MTRTDSPSAWDERTTLLTMLQYTRDTAAEKCRDLVDEHVGSSTAARVAADVTRRGGQPHALGRALVDREPLRRRPRPRAVDRRGAGPRVQPRRDPPLAQTLQEYAEQAVRTDAIIAGLDLDDRSASPFRSGEHPTLRWVILHLIEENARHNGHLDILRELADGTTGD